MEVKQIAGAQKWFVILVISLLALSVYGCGALCASANYKLYYEDRIRKEDRALEMRINDRLDRITRTLPDPAALP